MPARTSSNRASTSNECVHATVAAASLGAPSPRHGKPPQPPPWRARRRERATLPASPSGGIGWKAGGMARSWNDPDASGSPRGTHFSGWSPKGGYSLGRLPDGQEEPPDNPRVAQRTEQPPPKRQAAGSSPAVGAISCDRRPIFVGSPQKTAFYSQKDESKRNGATAPVAARACRSRPMGPSSPERTRYPPSRRQRRGFAAREKPLNPPRVQGLNDQRRPAMTLSERLDRWLAWLLFEFDPTPLGERHPWIVVGTLLIAFALVGGME